MDNDNSEFMAPWNHLKNIHKVYTSADTAVQSANSDTPYSWMGMDLRAEPMVISLLARVGPFARDSEEFVSPLLIRQRKNAASFSYAHAQTMES